MAYPKFPIRPFAKNMPSDLAGHTNGQVPEDLMVLVGRRGSKMHHTAARGWACLMWHAEQAGFRWDLASVDPRTYARQVAMFDGTNPKTWISNDGRYVPEDKWAQATAAGVRWTTDVRSWNGKRWKRRAGTAMAAVPGTSPHGWALAVDLAEQDARGNLIGITEAFAEWLVRDDMALRCGFGWSDQSEPWHLQWFAGDDVPADVLAWERAQQIPNPGPKPDPKPDPTPTPLPHGGDLMITVFQPSDCDAEFIGMVDKNGNALEIEWIDSAAAQARRDAHIGAGARIDKGPATKKRFTNCILRGRVPVGDSQYQWSAADFFRVDD